MTIVIAWKNPWLRAVVLGVALGFVLTFGSETVQFVYQAY
jgi:hypothetical protein